MKKEYVSVIIPVYKDYVGLQDTLESLSRQTLAKSKYEIIVANDGADKKISEVCKKYRVIEVKIAKNKGSYNARNKALEVSRGEYLAFTDADVKVPTKWLENGIKALKYYDYIGGDVNFPSSLSLTLIEKYEKKFEFNTTLMYKELFFFVTANLFTKRNIISNIGGFDTRLYSGGDNEFGNRIYFFSNFKRQYIENINVIHPHRDYCGVIKKMKRVLMGYYNLYLFYPQRFKHYKFNFINELFNSLYPPKEFIVDKKLFLFIWWMRLIGFYYKFIIFKFNNYQITKNIT